jgi:hypothetical protein
MFRGLTDDMGGNVFQCYEEQDDRRQYAKTIEALDAYAKKNLSYTADLSPIFAATMTEPKIERPVAIEEGADKLDKMIFAEEAKEYVKRTRSLKSNLCDDTGMYRTVRSANPTYRERKSTRIDQVVDPIARDLETRFNTCLGFKRTE